MPNFKKPTVFSFFTGIGGADHGYEQAGFRPIGGLDNWDFISEVWKNLDSKFPLRNQNFLDVNPRTVPCADLLHFSPPCQDFSILTNRERSETNTLDTPRKILDIVLAVEPKWVVIENVFQYRSILETTIAPVLRDSGYTVDIQILDSSKFGSYQQRKRAFLRASKYGQTDSFTALPSMDLFQVKHRQWASVLHPSDGSMLKTDLEAPFPEDRLIFQKTSRLPHQPTPTITGGIARTRARLQMNKQIFRLSNHHLAILSGLDHLLPLNLHQGQPYNCQKMSTALGNAVDSYMSLAIGKSLLHSD